MTNPIVKLVSDKTRAAPREQQLPVILSITKEMLERAKKNNWEAVIDLESQRTALIADFFATPVSGREVSAVANYLNKILEVDRQLIELGDNECQHLRENLQKINHSKRAMKVYTAAGIKSG